MRASRPCLSASRPLLSVFPTTGRAQPESSFNTNGSAPPYDLMKRLGGLTEEDAWLAPNPGGAASWGLGYYPAGVKGVRLSAAASWHRLFPSASQRRGAEQVGGSGSAAMYVLSTEEWFGATW